MLCLKHLLLVMPVIAVFNDLNFTLFVIIDLNSLVKSSKFIVIFSPYVLSLYRRIVTASAVKASVLRNGNESVSWHLGHPFRISALRSQLLAPTAVFNRVTRVFTDLNNS